MSHEREFCVDGRPIEFQVNGGAARIPIKVVTEDSPGRADRGDWCTDCGGDPPTQNEDVGAYSGCEDCAVTATAEPIVARTPCLTCGRPLLVLPARLLCGPCLLLSMHLRHTH